MFGVPSAGGVPADAADAVDAAIFGGKPYYWRAGVILSDGTEWRSEAIRGAALAADAEARNTAAQRGGKPFIEYWSQSAGVDFAGQPKRITGSSENGVAGVIGAGCSISPRRTSTRSCCGSCGSTVPSTRRGCRTGYPRRCGLALVIDT